MKIKTLHFLLFHLSFLLSLASFGVECPSLDAAFLKGELNKTPCFYKVGEEIVFTVKMVGAGKELKTDDWQVKWERTGEDGGSESGYAPLPIDNPLVIKTKSTKPGTVRLLAEVVDKQNEVYRKNVKEGMLTPDGTRPMNHNEMYDKRVFFDGSALVEPEKAQQVPEPEDFDEFWKKQKDLLASVPMKVLECEDIHATGQSSDVFRIKLSCAGPRPVTGYICRPKLRKEEGRKFPARLDVDGYGCGKMRPNDGNAGQREIIFHINAHGFELDQDDKYYQDFDKSIRDGKWNYAFSPNQNAKPETCYFYGMALRVMRALEYLKTIPEWDGKTLVASGGSQGGLQAVWAAGLDKDVSVCKSAITWCCDMGGEKLGRLRGGWYIQGTDALRYFDPVNHIKRMNPAAELKIPRAGLGDYVCPPIGLWFLYNNAPCAKKSIHWVQGSSHGYVPPPPYQEFDITKE